MISLIAKEKLIKCENVKVLPVPQYEGLTIKNMLAFAEDKKEVMRALPMVEHEILKLPRQYIANIIYSIEGDPFAEWVQLRVLQRNQKIASERDLMIEMDAEIAAIFKASTSVSGK